MTLLEKILEKLRAMPESSQAEVLNFVEYLKSKEKKESENEQWAEFSLDSAMRGIAEEPALYEIQDVKERF